MFYFSLDMADDFIDVVISRFHSKYPGRGSVSWNAGVTTAYYVIMPTRKFGSYPENAPGAFYVEKDLCITCRAPEAVAPDLIGFHKDQSGSNARSHCYFKKQPETSAEIECAIKAVSANCCGSFRYAGSDREVIKRLRRAQCQDAIDR